MSHIGNNPSNQQIPNSNAVQQEFLNNISKDKKEVPSGTDWQKKMTPDQINEPNLLKRKRVNHDLRAKHNLPIHTVALKILFSESLLRKMIKLRDMPEKTLDQKVEKENAFRHLVLEKFTLKQTVKDNNACLRAIISGLTGEMDPKCEEMTAIILRGDIIQHVMQYPELYNLDNNTEELQSYSSEFLNSNTKLGDRELKAMSHLLATPIHLFSYNDARINTEDELLPSSENTFGSTYNDNTPICIYHDPVREEYHTMKPKHS